MTDKDNKSKYFFIGVITTVLVIGIVGSIIVFITNRNVNSEEIADQEEKKDVNQDNLKDNHKAKNSKDINIKQIDLISKNELENLIDYEIRPDSLKYVYEKLSSYETWQKQGYSLNDSKAIANRFIESNNQAYGILKGISYNDKSLKLILIPKDDYLKVNFGTGTPDENSDTLPSPVTDSNIKEIDLEIEYGDDEIQLEYEVKNDGSIKSKYKNEITGEETQDKQTQNLIESTLLKIDYLGTQEDIISEVLKNLDLNKDYDQFEIEVDFFNNNKVQFKITK